MNHKVLPYLFGLLFVIGSASIADAVLIPDNPDPEIERQRAWESDVEDVELENQRLNPLEQIVK